MEYSQLDKAVPHLQSEHENGQNQLPPSIEKEIAIEATAADHIIDQDIEAQKEGPTGFVGDQKNEVLAGIQPSLAPSTSDTLREHDPHIVDWDGPDDVNNPYNWTMKKKWINILIISFNTTLTPLASSIFAPTIPAVLRDFHSTSETLSSFVVSVYLLGFCIGPIVFAPLSELYGRQIIYHFGNIGFLIFTIACGESTSMNMLIVFRFFAGTFGCAPLTIGGGSIADLVEPEQRGKFMALYAMGPLIGPVIGPIIGGYLGQAKGWRWNFYLLAIMIGFILVVSLIFLVETHAPTLLKRKTKKLNQTSDEKLYRSKYHSDLPKKTVFSRAIIRPLKLLFFSPIVFFLSLYMAIVYGYLYLLFTTFYVVFEGGYHFSSGTVGLTYLGIGVGSFVGLMVVGVVSDKLLIYLTKKNGVRKPEYRLPPMLYSSWCVPVGLFWYGWTAQTHQHWILPIIGTIFVGIGLLGTFMPIQTYLVDAFTIYAASAIAANTILRSLLGALLPLAGVPLYKKLGVGWGNSLLGFIAVALMPIPWIFNKYGERIRLRYKDLKLD